MKYCPKCNHISSGDEVNFCYQDGTKMEELKGCPRCKHKLGPFSRFCESCDTAILAIVKEK